MYKLNITKFTISTNIKQEDDDGMLEYYSNGKVSKGRGRAEDEGKKADYPFEDDFVNEKETNNNLNDFDPLSGPSEDSNGNGKGQSQNQKKSVSLSHRDPERKTMTQVTCDVNQGKFRIDCFKDPQDEVYVPFSFLRKYFEVCVEQNV